MKEASQVLVPRYLDTSVADVCARVVLCLSLTLLPMGCATAEHDTSGIPGQPPGSAGPDAAPEPPIPGEPDAGSESSPPDAGDPQPTSLMPVLSEVAVTPTPAEFIELHNPGSATTSLTNVYLSDSPQYMFTPGAAGLGPSASVSSSDFIVRFPDGESIPGQGAITVAFNGDAFASSYGLAPDYCLTGTGCTPLVAVHVGTGTITLTNSGEPVILFSWDGQSDLVADIDIIRVGQPSSGNDLQNKSGVTVDGPDGDSSPSAYPTESWSLPTQAAAPGDGQSTKRIAMPLGEASMPENYATGLDQTSEDTSLTWDTSYTAPTPGVFP